MDINKSNIEWIDWLNKNKVNTLTTHKYIVNSSRKESEVLNTVARYLKNLIKTFETLTDTRVEWDKDRWNVKNLEEYGIKYNKSDCSNCIEFSKINNEALRDSCKQLVKII